MTLRKSGLRLMPAAGQHLLLLAVCFYPPLAASLGLPAAGPDQALPSRAEVIMPRLAVPPTQGDEKAAPSGASTKLNTAQFEFHEFLSAQKSIKFQDLLADRPSINEQAFAELSEYVALAYSGTQVSKTITVGRQKFDCIPVGQQPSLRGGKVADTPPNEPESPRPHGILGSDTESCPAGNIPFRRMTLSFMSTFETLDDFLSKDRGLRKRSGKGNYEFEFSPRPQANPGDGTSSDGYVHRYSTIEQSAQVSGIASSLNVWSPKAPIGQMSLSQIWVVGEGIFGTQTIEVGWQVGEWFERDRAVPFVYWTSDGYRRTGCYDLECAGFVQTTNRVVFAKLSEALYSVPNGAQSELEVEVRQKAATGNWWLKLNGVWVGYWPRTLYANGTLADTAPTASMQAGGENTGAAPLAEMGSGRHASSGYRSAAYQSNLRFWNAAGNVFPIVGKPHMTDASCYSHASTVAAPQNSKKGSYFYFGGPGTADPNCK